MNLDTCFVCGVDVTDGYILCDACMEEEWPDEEKIRKDDRKSIPADNEAGISKDPTSQDELPGE
jgi:hypothetical protein